MAGLEALTGLIGKWFGFVGACVAGAGPACRPFLAFVALTAAAGAALALLVLAYRSLKQEEAHAIADMETAIDDKRLEPQWRAPASAAMPVRHTPAESWRVAA